MEESFRSRSLNLSCCDLFEIRLVRVGVIGLDIAECRRHWFEAVVCDHDGLRVLEFRERLNLETKVGLRVVALRGGDIRSVRDGVAGEETDAGVVPALGEVVADLELIFFPAKLASSSCREVIRKREKYLGAKGLDEGAPCLSGERRFQRADALRSDNGNATGLPGQTEKLLIPSRLVLTNGGKVLVFIAEKQYLAEILVLVGFDQRYAVYYGPLEIELHHYAQSLGEPWIQADGEIEAADLAVFDEPTE